MPPRTTTALLAQVAYWYYLQDLSQDEIASRIGVSRSQVSRFLRAAREQRVVRFQIAFPTSRDADLETRLRDRYATSGLREMIVARSDSSAEADAAEAARLAVARAVVDWLPQRLEDDMVLALSWGTTVQTVVDLIEFAQPVDVRVVQLTGEIGADPRHSGHDQVRDLADRSGGRRTYFNAAAVLPTAELAEALAESPPVRDALRLARAADVAVMGIGEFDKGGSKVFLDQADVTEAERRDARRKGVVGQICGRFFDQAGQPVELDLHHRVLSVSIADLARIPLKVVTASGANKALPVAAALRGGLIDVLVIDDALAARLAALPDETG